MSLSLDRYRLGLEHCLIHAAQCFGETATIWRELADSYRILIDLEEQEIQLRLTRSSLLSVMAFLPEVMLKNK